MKTILIISLYLSCIYATPAYLPSWSEFKQIHSKSYATTAEELRRTAIFTQNLQEINEHNEKYQNGETTYKKTINSFGDWTREEFLAYVNKGKIAKNASSSATREFVSKNATSWGAVDWRQNGVVTQVKNQGSCGSCWSFSATGALEGQLALKTRKLVSLSEQNLIDCSVSYGNNACQGGYMGSAFDYVRDYGIEAEMEYPYEGQLDYCRYQRSRSVVQASGYYNIPTGNEAALQDAVTQIGPISVAIDATDALQFYSSGFFYDYSCNTQELNHGVLVVGYGSEGGYDYWLIKNSWGASWGESGYYKAARNQGNNCGVASDASYPVL